MDLNESIGESLGKHYYIYFNLLRKKGVEYLFHCISVIPIYT